MKFQGNLTDKNKGTWQMEHVISRTVTHHTYHKQRQHTDCTLSRVVQLVQGHLYFNIRKCSMKRSLYLCQLEHNLPMNLHN